MDNRTGGFVLKFISGKYQGGEFPLEKNSEIVIGRSSDLDMVLVEDMVSRTHARITTHNDQIQIEDFKSTNGTFVNGERVTKARLKEGDRILVGTNIIKLVHRDVSEPMGKDLNSGGNGNMTATRTTGATLTGSISGLIEEVPLPDLLQLFSTSKKSGVLVIHQDNTIGKVYLKEGRVKFALTNDNVDVDPYKVFYRLLGWEYGMFSLEHPTEETFENEMDDPVEALMMEGMRILDEIRALGDDVPKLTDKMIISKPLVAPLRSLSPELMDSLQLVYNYGQVSDILDASLSGDLETMQDLVNLMRSDYVTLT